MSCSKVKGCIFYFIFYFCEVLGHFNVSFDEIEGGTKERQELIRARRRDENCLLKLKELF